MNRYALHDLDEAIDRVAATMTAVAADDTLSTRIVAGLAERRTRFSILVWAVPTAAAAVLFAVMAVGDSGSKAARTGDPIAALPSRPLTVGASLVAATDRLPVHRQLPPTVNAPTEELPAFPQIAALTGPRGLVMADLPAETLDVAPVGVAPLVMADLKVDAIDDDKKE